MCCIRTIKKYKEAGRPPRTDLKGMVREVGQKLRNKERKRAFLAKP
jgi:hypothetical protein